MKRGSIVLEGQLAPAFVPVDMSGGANAGDWFSMEDGGPVDVVFLKAVGTAGDDPVLTLRQAQDAAGTGAKALALSTYYKKQGATALSAVGQFTAAEAGTPGTFGGAEEATSAENEALWVIPVDPRDLDHANGFSHIQATVADVGGNAQLGCVLYVGRLNRTRGAVQPSALD